MLLHPRHLNVMLVHSDYLISFLSLLFRPQFTVGLLILTIFSHLRKIKKTSTVLNNHSKQLRSVKAIKKHPLLRMLFCGSPCRTRTINIMINSHALCKVSAKSCLDCKTVAIVSFHKPVAFMLTTNSSAISLFGI